MLDNRSKDLDLVAQFYAASSQLYNHLTWVLMVGHVAPLEVPHHGNAFVLSKVQTNCPTD